MSGAQRSQPIQRFRNQDPALILLFLALPLLRIPETRAAKLKYDSAVDKNMEKILLGLETASTNTLP